MTSRVLIKSSQISHLAKAAREERCTLEVVKDGITIRIIPDGLDDTGPMTLDKLRQRMAKR